MPDEVTDTRLTCIVDDDIDERLAMPPLASDASTPAPPMPIAPNSVVDVVLVALVSASLS